MSGSEASDIAGDAASNSETRWTGTRDAVTGATSCVPCEFGVADLTTRSIGHEFDEGESVIHRSDANDPVDRVGPLAAASFVEGGVR